MKTRIVVVGIAAVALLACSSSTKRSEDFKAARETAKLSLTQSIGIAEKESKSSAIRASILVGDAKAYSVTTVAGTTFTNIRVDSVDGKVLSSDVVGVDKECPGATSLATAIEVAEKEKNGSAVAIGPDDDDPCDREVKVLSGSTLWEIKVDRAGKVIEVEEDDGESED